MSSTITVQGKELGSLKHLHMFERKPTSQNPYASNSGGGEDKDMKTGVEVMDERTQVMNDLHEKMKIN